MICGLLADTLIERPMVRDRERPTPFGRRRSAAGDNLLREIVLIHRLPFGPRHIPLERYSFGLDF